jgi:hypothetical protein
MEYDAQYQIPFQRAFATISLSLSLRLRHFELPFVPFAAAVAA